MEIFNKAIQLARITLERGQPEILDRPPDSRRAGEWRLHMQGVKVLMMAVENVARAGGRVDAQHVIGEIEALEARHGTAWQKAKEGGKTWYYKDFNESGQLIETLEFIRKLDVHYKRLDQNPLDEAMHLRMSPNDYHRIFNPLKHFNMETGRGGSAA